MQDQNKTVSAQDAEAAAVNPSADAAANDAYTRALGEADALRIPLDLREVAADYSAWLVRSGELPRAGATAERVAAWSARDFDSAIVQLRVQRALGDANLGSGGGCHSPDSIGPDRWRPRCHPGRSAAISRMRPTMRPVLPVE